MWPRFAYRSGEGALFSHRYEDEASEYSIVSPALRFGDGLACELSREGPPRGNSGLWALNRGIVTGEMGMPYDVFSGDGGFLFLPGGRIDGLGCYGVEVVWDRHCCLQVRHGFGGE